MPLGADERFAFGAFPAVGVEAGVTSVAVPRQTARTLAATGDSIRDIDDVTPKPEVSSTLDIATVPMRQVAGVQTQVPNIHLESDLISSVVENDLRLSMYAALDSLVQAGLATAGNTDPTGVSLIAAIRAGIETIQAAGYSPDTLIVDPTTATTLDTLVADAGTEFYVFSPGQYAPGIFGLSRRISTDIPAPVVVDSSAFAKLYTSPVSLARFEENDGATNSSTVRLECHAAFGVERVAAATRIAA